MHLRMKQIMDLKHAVWENSSIVELSGKDGKEIRYLPFWFVTHNQCFLLQLELAVKSVIKAKGKHGS